MISSYCLGWSARPGAEMGRCSLWDPSTRSDSAIRFESRLDCLSNFKLCKQRRQILRISFKTFMRDYSMYTVNKIRVKNLGTFSFPISIFGLFRIELTMKCVQSCTKLMLQCKHVWVLLSPIRYYCS